GDAHAVAGFAEIVRQGRDEAEPPTGLGDPHIAGWTTGSIVDLVESEPLGKPRPHDREWQILIQPAFAHVPSRHDFDERQIHPLAVRPADEGFELVLVYALEGDGIDLDGEAGILRGLDPIQNLIEVAPTRHGTKLRRVEGIERDVDAPDPLSG